MRILVTGCNGNVGKVTVEALLGAGHEVVGIGRSKIEVEGVEYIPGNVKDYDTVLKAIDGCDTVIHLAAYNMPVSAEEQEIFQVNVGGTFNIFKACAVKGIKRLIVASSPNAIGYNFGHTVQDVSYIPVDGVHPNYTTDPYSFGKETIESIGRYFWRRYGISSVFMRLGLEFTNTVEEWLYGNIEKRDTNGVMHLDSGDGEPIGPTEIRFLRKWLDDLLKLPQKDAAEEVRRIENAVNESRHAALGGEPYRYGTEYVYAHFTPEQKVWNYYVHNFMMFLDKRDLASAMLCALDAKYEGAHNIFVADCTNMVGIESRRIAPICYPGAAIHYDKLVGYDAMVDYRYTEKLIGFKAAHPMSDYYGILFG